jgi:streptogramin lyase
MMRIEVFAILSICLLPCCATAGDYDVILASYGEPELIAGLGQIQDVNGWLPSMEGANALSVELSNTHMTMADAAGNLFLVDKESHAVLKMTPDGVVSTVVGTHVAGNGGDTPQPGTAVALSNPNGLYVLPNGTAYILDRDNDKIRRLDTNGVVTTVIPDTGDLSAGRGLWVSPDTNTMFYTCSTVVRTWTSTGGVSVYASGFVNLGNIDVDPRDGVLAVTDRGAHRVYRVFPDGSREVIAGNGTKQHQGDGGPATNAGLDEVRGIAFLPNGGYFLATQGDGDVWYVDTDNIAHEFIAGDKNSTQLPYDEVCEPRAVSVAPWGDLIITENDFGVVRVVRRMLAFPGVGLASPGALSLTWFSMPALSYRVLFTEDLVTTNWQTLAVVPGNPSNIVTTYSNTNTLNAWRGFYRISQNETTN